MQYDISEIGTIECTLNFDQDFYEEYLSDNGIQDSSEARMNYVRTDCDYDVEMFDSDTDHHLCYEVMTLEEIESEFGEALAADVFKDCMDGRPHQYEPLAYENTEVDLNNPDQVNAMAVKVLRHGGYEKGARGFILTNGVVVYTDAEHSMCTRINGVKSTFHFIDMGNVRVLDRSIDIAQKPTPQQVRVISQMLDEYMNEPIYLDLMNKQIGYAGKKYEACDPDEVLNDISNYFSRGIKPKIGLYEKRTIIITEAQYKKLLEQKMKNP